MLAIHVKNDESRQLYLAECPMPEYRSQEVLIKVHATAVNRADLLQRRGFYPPPPGASDIMGLEAAGVIVATGAEVSHWQVGDRVCCLLPGGGYAEYVNCPQDLLLAIPPAWTFELAAALPEAFYTAFANLFGEARLRAREIALIHAGASGVGTAAIQLARYAGAWVIVTAGSETKLERCLELGANHAINYRTGDFAERVLKITNGAGVDVILDCIGASYLAKNLSLLKLKGRLVIIGVMGGAKAEIDLAVLLRRRQRVIGSVLRSRTLEEKAELTRQFRGKVMPLLRKGLAQPVIDCVFPLTAVEQAHAYVATNRNVGKVVLQVEGLAEAPAN